MKFKVVLMFFTTIILSGCTVHHISPSLGKYQLKQINKLTINDLTPQTEPQIVFDTHPGINSRASYKEWSAILVAQFSNDIEREGVNINTQKELSILLHKMHCGGHYVAVCTVKASINTPDGYKVLVVGEGHGDMRLAIEDAMVDISKKFTQDTTVLAYLGGS